MSTELTIKKGRGVPRDADLAEAELAVDLDSGTLYSKLGDGLVHPLNESPDSDNYGHWKLQVDYGTPYQVVSGATANFEGTNGIKVTRTGDTITIDGSELDLDEEADCAYEANAADCSTQNVRWQVDRCRTRPIRQHRGLRYRCLGWVGHGLHDVPFIGESRFS